MILGGGPEFFGLGASRVSCPWFLRCPWTFSAFFSCPKWPIARCGCCNNTPPCGHSPDVPSACWLHYHLHITCSSWWAPATRSCRPAWGCWSSHARSNIWWFDIERLISSTPPSGHSPDVPSACWLHYHLHITWANWCCELQLLDKRSCCLPWGYWSYTNVSLMASCKV